MELFDEVQDYQPTPMERQHSSLTFFLFLITLMVMGNILSAGVIYLMEQIYHLSFQDIVFRSKETNISLPERNFIRWASLITHLLTFTVPALGTVLLLSRRNWTKSLSLHFVPKNYNIFLAILFIMFSFPLAQLGLWINQQIPLPSWALAAEANSEMLLKHLLTMDHPTELVLNVFVIAFIPAIGEELVFRGVLQTKLSQILKQEWVAIWITATIFSAFHFQFAGFIPRLVLGAVLGYLFSWTKNLWIPIIAHAFLNGIQLMASYQNISSISTDDQQIDEIIVTYWPFFLLSTLLFLGLGYLMMNYNRNQQRNTATSG